MSLATTANLVEMLRQYRLLTADQLAELERDLLPPSSEPRALAKDLIGRGWLTPYQANQLFLGRGHELLLGSYVLLARLGEGGMGKVFKAKNWKFERVVAVKVIRKERLAGEDTVRRFHREVHAVAQLSHPNVVHAYDADAVNGIHFLVMEYVEGTDLAKLVKRRGPLAVAEACEYVRQAALGLQHAFEKGMVHRDIKPHNLLLTREGVVKVLDLGLARVKQAAGESGSSMTGSDCVVGTPDYMSPEQARDSHAADTRADLYSLGCTLYYLLTARVPFPRGSSTEKLLQHNLDEPTPVEELRPEIPPAVAAVVRKLMAKRMEDRYQTPAEAAAALAAVGNSPAPPVVAVEDQANSDELAFLEGPPDEAQDFLPVEEAGTLSRAAERRRRLWRRWLLAGAVVAALLAGAGLHFLLRK